METRIKTMATTANSANQAGPIKGITSKREVMLESLDAFLKDNPDLVHWFGQDMFDRIKQKVLSLPAGYSVYLQVHKAGHDDQVLRTFPKKLFSEYDLALGEHYIVGFKLIAATGYKYSKEHSDFWKKDLNKVTFDRGAIVLLEDRL